MRSKDPSPRKYCTPVMFARFVCALLSFRALRVSCEIQNPITRENYRGTHLVYIVLVPQLKNPKELEGVGGSSVAANNFDAYIRRLRKGQTDRKKVRISVKEELQ